MNPASDHYYLRDRPDPGRRTVFHGIFRFVYGVFAGDYLGPALSMRTLEVVDRRTDEVIFRTRVDSSEVEGMAAMLEDDLHTLTQDEFLERWQGSDT